MFNSQSQAQVEEGAGAISVMLVVPGMGQIDVDAKGAVATKLLSYTPGIYLEAVGRLRDNNGFVYLAASEVAYQPS